jgi:DNA-binding CsgD family transcriptional regulator
MPAHTSPEKEKSIYQLLLHCGQQRNVTDFCCQLVKELPPLIAYDQARVILFDESGSIQGARLFGVKESKWRDFLYYYENNIVYNQSRLVDPYHPSDKDKITVQNYWCYMDQPSEFTPYFLEEYVRSLRLLHTLGIGFCDSENCLRSLIVLERLKDPPFVESEVDILRKIHPLLENYHIDLLLSHNSGDSPVKNLQKNYSLTKRESEIVTLLMESLTPAQISQRISISVTTVNRHIANIYLKCHISNRQQLYKLFAEQQTN